MINYLDSRTFLLPLEVISPDLAIPVLAPRQISHQHRGLAGNQNPDVGAVLPSGTVTSFPAALCPLRESWEKVRFFARGGSQGTAP